MLSTALPLRVGVSRYKKMRAPQGAAQPFPACRLQPPPQTRVRHQAPLNPSNKSAPSKGRARRGRALLSCGISRSTAALGGSALSRRTAPTLAEHATRATL